MLILSIFIFIIAETALGDRGSNDPLASLEGVLDLDETTFDAHIGKDAAALVEFYAPWCGHCKALVPEYKRLGNAVKHSAAGRIIVAKVNAEENRALASRFGVTGYPTIKFFPAGSDKPDDYNGGRTAPDFAKFFGEKTGITVTFPYEHSYVTVLNANNFDKIVKDQSKDVLVEFYAPWCGHCKSLAPNYEIIAAAFKNEKDIVIAKIDADAAQNKEIASRYGVTGFPTLKWFPKNQKDTPEDYNERDPANFISFINDRCKKYRNAHGELTELAGLDTELSDLAKAFVKSKGDIAGAEFITQMEDRAKILNTETARYYVKVAKAISEKGQKYVIPELTRVLRLLEQGKVSGEKRDSLSLKRNVLREFREFVE